MEVLEEDEDGEKELLSKESSPVYVFLDEVTFFFSFFFSVYFLFLSLNLYFSG